MLCKLQSQSKLLGHFAVQWRIQGRGQGEPGSPLIFKPNWGPKGRKKIFDTIPPPPPAPLSQGLDDRSPPYLKVWFRHCRLLALPMLVYKIWRVNCDKQNWKDEKMGQKLKKQRWVEVFQLFLAKTVALVTIQNSDNERWNYCVVGCSYSMKMNDTTLLRQLTMISTDPCRHNLKTLFPFLVAKLHINIIMDDKKITIILFLFKNEQYFYI